PEQLARLVAGRVEDLSALAVALLPVPLDLRLALLQLALASPDLLLGLAELGRGRRLGVALDRVGELGGGTDEMERVHPHGVARRLDLLGAAPGGLEHSKLCLQLRGMAAERLERLANAVLVVALAGALEVLDPRQRGQ